MNLRRRVAGLVATAALVGGLVVVGTAEPAAAATCPDHQDVFVPSKIFRNGESHYSIICAQGRVWVTGYVKNLAIFGCTVVELQFASRPGRPDTVKACGLETQTKINHSGRGNTVYVRTWRAAQ